MPGLTPMPFINGWGLILNLEPLLQEEIGQLEAEVAEEQERCGQQMLAARRQLESQATEVCSTVQ